MTQLTLAASPERAPRPRSILPSVFALFTQPTGEVLLVRAHGMWNLPGGQMDRGETRSDALRRELMEEICVMLPRDMKLESSREVDRPWKGRAAILFEFKVRTMNARASSEIEEVAWFPRSRLPKDLTRTAACFLQADLPAAA